MRKIIYLMLFFMMLTFNVKAQYKPFQFGLKVAPGFSWIETNTNGLDKASGEFNFNWGFVGDFYFVENYGISTGFDVISLNGSYTFDNTLSDGNWKNDVRLKYLQIPVGLKMRTAKVGDMRIFGHVAYGLGFLLGSDITTYNGDVKCINDVKCNNLRSALIVKLGIEYQVFGSSCITAALSLNDNFNDVIGKCSFDHDIKCSSINFEIGFLF